MNTHGRFCVHLADAKKKKGEKKEKRNKSLETDRYVSRVTFMLISVYAHGDSEKKKQRCRGIFDLFFHQL